MKGKHLNYKTLRKVLPCQEKGEHVDYKISLLWDGQTFTLKNTKIPPYQERKKNVYITKHVMLGIKANL